MRSVTFQGAEMSLEAALDMLIRDMQGALNGLQCKLRELAAVEDQQIDEEEDFKMAVELDDDTNDLVLLMTSLLKELPAISKDILGKPPPALREWHKQHVLTRKAEQAAEKQRAAEAKRAEKEAEKTITVSFS